MVGREPKMCSQVVPLMRLVWVETMGFLSHPKEKHPVLTEGEKSRKGQNAKFYRMVP